MRLRAAAVRLRQELSALSLALRDLRTPWYARAVGGVVLAYALSPIDLIPDFIPVVGYLDDVVLLSLGLWLVVKLIPAEVLAESQARTIHPERTAHD